MASKFGLKGVSMNRSVTSIVLLLLIVVTCCSFSGCKKKKGGDEVSTMPIQTERRAAFDIGSGTMKLRVSDVIVTKDHLETALEVTGGYERIRVDFEADLHDSKDGRFSHTIMEKGIKTLKELKKRAVQAGAKVFAGVATRAFRTAKNGEEYLRRLEEETGIRLQIASAAEEARMGFLAAVDSGDFSPKNLVVWDIGGGGSSLTMQTEDGEFVYYFGELASVVLRDTIIRTIQNKPKSVKTPNPISHSEVRAALDIVRGEAVGVPLKLRRKLADPNTKIVGIGPVHFHSVRGQVKAEEMYSRLDVATKLKERTGMTDKEIGDPWADTEVVNLILVLGFLEALDIEELEAMNVNVADGLLVDPNYW